MIKDRRLGHLGMASRDVDATVAWYVDVLGFEKIGEFKAPNGKINCIIIQDFPSFHKF